MIAKSLVVVLMCCLGAALTVKISDYITPCSFKDPQLNDCATIQARALLPYMVEGIRDWEVPAMSPLLLPEIVLNRSTSSYFGLFLTFTNSSHHGWKNINFRNVKFDTKNYTMDVELTIDHYIGAGNYEVQGHILQVPISGKGTGTLKTRNVYETLHVKFEKEERNGQTYLKPLDVKTRLLVKYSHYDVKNLFGNEVLSDLMNVFINNNAPAIYREVQPYIETIISKIILSIMQSMFAKIPMNEMFKDVD